MGPAGESASDKQSVVLKAFFFIHADAGLEGKAGFRESIGRPFTAGIMEFMACPLRAERMEGVLGYGSGRDVAQPLRTGIEARAGRVESCHGPGAAVEEESFAEHHEAAAFRIDGTSGFGEGAYLRKMGRLGDSIGEEFGIAAAKVEGVEVRPGGRIEYAQRNELSTGIAQGIKIFLIVEPEGVVEHEAYAWPFLYLFRGRGRSAVRQRGGTLRKSEHGVDVGVFSEEIGKLVEQGVGRIVGTIQCQSHMALGKGIATQAGELAQHRDIRVLLYGLAEHGGVARVGHIVQDYAADAHTGLKGRHAGHDGGGGTRHFGAVHGEHDGSVQQARDVCRGTGARDVTTVEEASIAFDDGYIGRAAGADLDELAEQGFVVLEVGVKAGGGAAGGKGQPGIVYVVRPFLAGLYAEAADFCTNLM